MITLVHLKLSMFSKNNNKQYKTGVINDPLGQTHSLNIVFA